LEGVPCHVASVRPSISEGRLATTNYNGLDCVHQSRRLSRERIHSSGIAFGYRLQLPLFNASALEN
jgi:hypothetical protein